MPALGRHRAKEVLFVLGLLAVSIVLLTSTVGRQPRRSSFHDTRAPETQEGQEKQRTLLPALDEPALDPHGRKLPYRFPAGHSCTRMNDNDFFQRCLKDVILHEPKSPNGMYDEFLNEDKDDPALGDCIAIAIGHIHGMENTGKNDPNHKGVLGSYHKEVADAVVKELYTTGVAKVPLLLPKEWVQKLLVFLRDEMMFETHVPLPFKYNISFDWNQPVSKSHWGMESSLRKLNRFEAIRDLIVDPTILDVTQRYLRAAPINTQVRAL
jgi:hypothetical protein